MAVKIAAGNINAVTGNPWQDALDHEQQDFVEVPAQPWLDGFCVKKAVVRQFVAMPLGDGYTAEEPLDGNESFVPPAPIVLGKIGKTTIKGKDGDW